jgi:predicted enzyme related to lactoylglutathione lyase
MTQFLINVDVDDIDRAAAFYMQALELKTGRRLGDDSLELVGGPVPIYLLKQPAGSRPFRDAQTTRSYARHWSPVHLDFVVPDIRMATARAVSAGAMLEQPPRLEPYGWLALLSDPFGHGFCFLQFTGRGYDEIAQPEQGAP